MRTTAEEPPLFYDLTKDQMEAQCPSDLRVIIRKAFDNCRPGYGPGPTMDDIVKHYEDERNYFMMRGVSDDQILHQTLDVLFESNTQMEGVIAWRLPSIVTDSDQHWPVGRFNFSSAKRTHPKLYTRIVDLGWNI